MKSFTTVSLAASLIGITTVSAQAYIDPNSVSSSTRDSWCSSQKSSCPLICTQTTNSLTTDSNSCDPDNLSYVCTCSDGTSPNITQYTQTLPYFICSTWGDQCVSNCGAGNNACASDCRQNHPCGAQNPTRQNTSTLTSHSSTKATGMQTGSASDASATADSSGIYSGFGGAAATDDSSSGDDGSASASDSGAGAAFATILPTGQTLGLLTVVGALFGGFAVLL